MFLELLIRIALRASGFLRNTVLHGGKSFFFRVDLAYEGAGGDTKSEMPQFEFYLK